MSDYTIEQIAAKDLPKAGRQTGHLNADVIKRWQDQALADELVMFAVQVGDQYVASVNILLVEADEQAVIDEVGKLPTLNALGVNLKYRRRGIASQLLDACEDYVRNRSDLPDKLTLGVEVENSLARRIYEARGYVAHTVAGQETFESTWPETNAQGETRIYTAHCVLMIKDLA